VIAGLKSAEMVPKIEMIATRTAAVAAAFWNNWRPVSPGFSRAAMIPEPTTPISRNMVPTASARSRRDLTGFVTDPRIGTHDTQQGRGSSEQVRVAVLCHPP